MSKAIITAEGLSKAYRIGVQEERATTLAGAAMNLLKSPLRNFQRLRRLDTYSAHDDAADTYWALKDVSFEIAEGEVVGVIGRNGAGKSTLLKLLSRITDPTRGRAVLRGRVSSLLEVGTGFHPELSGRENVYLNGTILGMTKREVDRKFDEIVEFSGVEKFLDTPIKRYSSGMTVRLAFAVAAHLEPEILIIDEVLAVGDAEFQKKCLGKMKDVAQGGRTVLFVSHNMGAVKALCRTSLLLKGGHLLSQDSTPTVIAQHLSSERRLCGRYTSDRSSALPFVANVQLVQRGSVSERISIDAETTIEVTIGTAKASDFIVGLLVHNDEQDLICHISDEFCRDPSQPVTSPLRRCTLPPYLLRPGTYYLSVHIGKRGVQLFDAADYCLQFEVEWTGPMTSLTNESDWKGIVGPGIGNWEFSA